MKRIFLPVVVLAGLFAFGLVACSDDDSSTNNNNTSVTCDNDGTCDAGENPVNCPADCAVDCSLTGITGTEYQYVVKELYIPDSNEDALQNGVDLDGDGIIDNKLGKILALFSSSMDINDEVNANIEEGGLVLLGVLHVDAFPDDDEVLFQLFPGDVPTGGSTPIFDGNDELEIDAVADRTLFLCGDVDGGDLMVGPSDMALSFPLPGSTTIDVTLKRAQLNGPVTATSWTNVMVGGGITEQEIDTVVIPAIAEFINDAIQDDPGGTTATTVGPMFDGKCVTTIDGCESVVNGTGECSDEDDPIVISETELRCNLLLSGALAPDVDTDNDGEPDLLSLGLKVVEAVPCTITN